MSQKRALTVWLQTNAWREILARIFAEWEPKINISPDWLVNPATNRRLKLDLLYPTLTLAIRFEGLQGKNRRRRLSVEEEQQQRTRDEARVELCRRHGIELILIDVTDSDPKGVFQRIDLGLSRVGQQSTDNALSKMIRQARATAAALGRRIKHSDDLKLYAELWEDRQYQVAEPSTTPATSAPPPTFVEGMAVEHIKFGPGVVLAVAPNDNDTLVTVDFGKAGQKTLAASLVGDKLLPRSV